MNAKNDHKIDELTTEVLDAISDVRISYNLSWSRFLKIVNEIISNRDECEIRKLNDHNQWRKIFNGEVGSSYSYEWWLTLQSIIEELPNLLDKKAKALTRGLEKPAHESSFIPDLHQLGIIGTANKLSESKFKPFQCMQETKQSLFFMGILGSKWVKDKDNFKEFLIKIQAQPNGRVRFLMINPLCESFKVLKSMRGEHLKDESTSVFKELSEEFPCLEARYYSFIPCFRLIFIDNRTVAVSRYKLDKNNYLKSNQGWEAPHLIISSEGCEWSMYDPFLSYYQYVWDNAKQVKSIF